MARVRGACHRLRAVQRVAQADSLMMGVGNISGPGMALVNHYRDLHGSDLASNAEVIRQLPFGNRQAVVAQPNLRKAA